MPQRTPKESARSLEPAWLGPSDRQVAPWQPLPKVSRLHKAADGGPVVADDYLYKVVDALDAVAAETGKTVPQVALNWLLRKRPSQA